MPSVRTPRKPSLRILVGVLCRRMDRQRGARPRFPLLRTSPAVNAIHCGRVGCRHASNGVANRTFASDVEAYAAVDRFVLHVGSEGNVVHVDEVLPKRVDIDLDQSVLGSAARISTTPNRGKRALPWLRRDRARCWPPSFARAAYAAPATSCVPAPARGLGVRLRKHSSRYEASEQSKKCGSRNSPPLNALAMSRCRCLGHDRNHVRGMRCTSSRIEAANEFTAGAPVFHLGDAVHVVHFVRRGAINLVRTQEDGAALILQRARAGSILAEASVYSDRYHCALAPKATRLRGPWRKWTRAAASTQTPGNFSGLGVTWRMRSKGAAARGNPLTEDGRGAAQRLALLERRSARKRAMA